MNEPGTGQAGTGKVKFYDKSKGFGFISIPGGNGDLYFNRLGLADEASVPAEGEQVSFRIVQGKKGMKAIAVTRGK